MNFDDTYVPGNHNLTDYLEYIASGKIPAIKQLRRATNLSLREAKLVVEAIAQGCQPKYDNNAGEIERLRNMLIAEQDRYRALRAKYDKVLESMDRGQLLELLKGE